MPTTIELCKEYFDSSDLYDIFSIPKTAAEKDVKKAYYKLSLRYHPDRVSVDKKEEATEKFKLLSKLYNILSDDDKRKLYDEQGIIEDDDETSSSLSSWITLWKNLFKPITDDEIDKFKEEYIGSDMEKRDIKKSYLAGKGCIDHMMEMVMFFGRDDEPRIAAVVDEMIQSGEVPEYKMFTKEAPSKTKKRHDKLKREEKKAEKLAEKRAGQKDSLEQQLKERQLQRSQNADSFFNSLLDKYRDVDDDYDVELDKAEKKFAGKRKSMPSGGGKDKLHATVSGRVKKSKKK